MAPLEARGSVAILYHWDADGAASAAMLLQALGDAELLVPRIGFYRAEAVDTNRLRRLQPDTLLVVDYGLRQEELEKLLELSGSSQLVVVDHHLSDASSRGRIRVYNPTLTEGRGYPSTTWVLRGLLDEASDLLSVLGVAGDLEDRMVEHWAWPQVRGILEDHGWSVEALTLLGRMVSACYKALDYGCVLRAPEKLLDYGSDLDAALRDEEWRQAYRSVAEEAGRLLRSAEPEEAGRVLLYRFSSGYYLASELGRILSRRNPDKIVVIHYERGDGYVEIYVRSRSADLSEALEKARKSGLPAGGKSEVFAVQLPRGEAGWALEKLLEILGAR